MAKFRVENRQVPVDRGGGASVEGRNVTGRNRVDVFQCLDRLFQPALRSTPFDQSRARASVSGPVAWRQPRGPCVRPRRGHPGASCSRPGVRWTQRVFPASEPVRSRFGHAARPRRAARGCYSRRRPSVATVGHGVAPTSEIDPPASAQLMTSAGRPAFDELRTMCIINSARI